MQEIERKKGKQRYIEGQENGVRETEKREKEHERKRIRARGRERQRQSQEGKTEKK